MYNRKTRLKALFYTLLCFSRVLDFSHIFTRVLIPRKLPNARKMQENVIRYALGKNTSLLRFSCIFAIVFAHKPYQHAAPPHSVNNMHELGCWLSLFW